MSALLRNVRCCHSQKKIIITSPKRPQHRTGRWCSPPHPNRWCCSPASVSRRHPASRHPHTDTQTLWPTRTRFTDTIQGGNHSYTVSPYRVAAGCCPRLAGRGGAADGGRFPPLLLRLQQTRWRPPLCPLCGSAGCWWGGDGRTLSPTPVWRKVTG